MTDVPTIENVKQLNVAMQKDSALYVISNAELGGASETDTLNSLLQRKYFAIQCDDCEYIKHYRSRRSAGRIAKKLLRTRVIRQDVAMLLGKYSIDISDANLEAVLKPATSSDVSVENQKKFVNSMFVYGSTRINVENFTYEYKVFPDKQRVSFLAQIGKNQIKIKEYSGTQVIVYGNRNDFINNPFLNLSSNVFGFYTVAYIIALTIFGLVYSIVVKHYIEKLKGKKTPKMSKKKNKSNIINTLIVKSSNKT